MNPVLQVKQVEKYFGRANNLTRALNQISFEVQPGEFVAIMGASGSGKTTLLNCIATIDQVSSGQIIVANQDITKLKGGKLNQFRQKQIGFIFQDFNLLDTMNAFENIALGLEDEPEKGKRCSKCFELRLVKSAMCAKDMGINFFTTTLTVSPHKRSSQIFKVAENVTTQYGLEFLKYDFKKQDGFKISRQIAKENNMYFQQYCGCEFSIRKNN